MATKNCHLTDKSWKLLISKKNFSQIKFEQCKWLAKPLGEGQLLMKVSRVAFTANNITYAVLGEQMAYWRFFPNEDEAWGMLPVWGFAEVALSNHEQIKVGERVYGYWPLATHVVATPASITAKGYTDTTPHRHGLPDIYNQYQREENETESQVQNLRALLNPLFATSWLIDDFLANNDLFDSQTLVISSASSKTAMASAFLLRRNRGNRPNYKTIGLTSVSHLAFVNQLNLYDKVLSYDELEGLNHEGTLCYIDFAGNSALRARIHEQAMNKLHYSGIIGVTHWEDALQNKPLPGPAPTIFFAPSQFQQRVKDWGMAELRQRIDCAWEDFRQVTQHLNIVEGSGQQAVQETYRAMLEGRSDPRCGHVLLL